jgi:hypothetical protein
MGSVQGRGTERETLERAGIAHAVGIVAGTDDDVSNLAIAMNARAANSHLFVVVRQNLVASSVLFAAFRADVTMVPSEIIAHECLAVLTTPLLSRFLDVVKAEKDEWADRVVADLHARVGDRVPVIWSVRIDDKEAPACAASAATLKLDSLVRSSAEREAPLACMALLLLRDGKSQPLPNDAIELQTADEILFAGTPEAKRLQALTLANANALDYVTTGREAAGGWLWGLVSR